MATNKLDFKNISIISHIRIDNKDRLENFLLRNSIFESRCENLEFVNVEDDIQRRIPQINREVYKLTNNSGLYNKNLSYNIGSKLTDRKYLIFLDIDCIIEPHTIKCITEHPKTVLNLQNTVIYPFEYVVYLKNDVKNKFKKNPTLENLILNSKKLDTSKNNLGESGALIKNSCGGCFILEKDFFKSVNGFNPNFYGWGYEDSEFRDRLKILDKNPIRALGSYMYHLPHGEHYFRRDKQDRLAEHNKKEYNKIINMSKEQCLEYMKTWKL